MVRNAAAVSKKTILPSYDGIYNPCQVLYPLAVFIVINLDQSLFNDKNSVPEPAFTTIIQGESLERDNPVVG